jgi:stalled ribosome rescue protein Dom34
MKNTGIWIDREKAHVVSSENGFENLITINSEVENYHLGGGSRSKSSFGQELILDRKYLEREKHQLKLYFKEIAESIKDADSIVIFGPADTNKKLSDELEYRYKKISNKVRDVMKADSMTDNQIKSLVRNYFNENC